MPECEGSQYRGDFSDDSGEKANGEWKLGRRDLARWSLAGIAAFFGGANMLQHSRKSAEHVHRSLDPTVESGHLIEIENEIDQVLDQVDLWRVSRRIQLSSREEIIANYEHVALPELAQSIEMLPAATPGDAPTFIDAHKALILRRTM